MSENEYIRPDGRKANQLRDIKVEVGVLNRADGSARVHLGKNIVLAAVNGPREMHPKHASQSQKAVVRVTYRMLPFSVDYRKNPYPSRREKEISKVLSEAFESVVLTKLYPRSAIDVHVQMIQADGGSRTAASIATSAALADAGIPMRGLIAGIASGLYEDQCVLDLSGIEDNIGTGDMPILYSPQLDEVSLFQLDGHFTLEQFKTCFNLSVDATKVVEQKQREALKQKYLVVRDQLQITDEDEEDFVEPAADDEIKEDVVAEKIDRPRYIAPERTNFVPVQETQPTTPEPVSSYELVAPEEPRLLDSTTEELTETKPTEQLSPEYPEFSSQPVTADSTPIVTQPEVTAANEVEGVSFSVENNSEESVDDTEKQKKEAMLTERDLELQNLELGDE